MVFQLEIDQPAKDFLASLTPASRLQLDDCWHHLACDPYADERTKHTALHSPIVYIHHRCGIMLTIYRWRIYRNGTERRVVTICDCDWVTP